MAFGIPFVGPQSFVFIEVLPSVLFTYVYITGQLKENKFRVAPEVTSNLMQHSNVPEFSLRFT